MRILRNIVQVSDEWFQEHLGRVSASHAAEILDFTLKGVEGSKRRNYRLIKALERLSGIPIHDNYVSAPMLAGIAAEPHARTTVEIEENVMIEQVGCVIGDDERTLWSPDGIVCEGETIVGGIECKGPQSTTYLNALDMAALGKFPIPDDYLPQLWFDFMVADTLQWLDFTMRDGGMEKDKQVIKDAIGNGADLSILPRRYKQFTVRYHRSDCADKIAKMRIETDRFLADVDATVERIKSICPEVAEPERVAEDFGDLGISDEEISAVDPSWKGEHEDLRGE